MKPKQYLLALTVITGLSLGGFTLYRLGVYHSTQQNFAMDMSNSDANDSQNDQMMSTDTDKKILYWHDPMVPGYRFDQPGKSPFMDMQLAPVYAEDGDATNQVSINPQIQQNFGIRAVEVVKGLLMPSVETIGNVVYNERNAIAIQARANGYLERLYVRAPLDSVRKGQALAELYVPDWIAAQEDYLSIKRMTTHTDGLLEAAQQRMRLVGMTDDQISRIKTDGKVHATVTITAPMNGVIGELNVREGMTVMTGSPLFRINGLNSVWVNAEIPESFAAQIKPGNLVEASTPALSGTVFKGKVSAILPEVNPTTRTLTARIELANPSGQLVPGMFATVKLSSTTRREVLLIPTEAVIQTGKRSVVMLALDDGKFQPIEVEIGTQANGQTEIRRGLTAGQKVIISGQFLIDSEASLKGITAQITDMPTPMSNNHSTNDQHTPRFRKN